MSKSSVVTSNIPRPRIVLADAHPILTEGISRLLEPDFDCVAAVTDGYALVNTTLELEPDLIVAEISLPSLGGIEALRKIRVHNAAVKMIFLSVHPEAVYAAEARRAGASGYLLKTCDCAELTRTIRIVSIGGTYFSPRLDLALLDSMTGGSSPRRKSSLLTPRQIQILQLIAEGYTRREIGTILNVSLKTVEFHKSCLAERLHLSSATELTHYAIQSMRNCDPITRNPDEAPATPLVDGLYLGEGTLE